MLASKPSTFLFLTQLPLLVGDRLRLLGKLHAEHGEFVELPIGPHKRYVAFHPDHVAHVLGQNAANYRKGRTFAATSDFLGEGLSTSEAENWKEQRQFLNPQFHKANIARITRGISEVVDETMLDWKTRSGAGELFNLSQEFRVLALSIATRCLFTTQLSHDEHTTIIKAMQKVLVHATTKGMLPFDSETVNVLYPSPGYRRAVDTLRSLAGNIVKNAEGEQFLAMLIADARSRIPNLTDEKMIDNVVTFMIGASDTTANTMAWIAYELCSNSHLLPQLEKEVTAAGDLTDFDNLSKLSLLSSCIDETLRLHPQNWLMSRDVIAEDEIGGFEVAAGSTVYLATYVVHRRPDFWDEPNRFEPLRFAPQASARRHPYAYFPFGAGPRRCIGVHFAMTELKVMFARLFSQFDVTVENIDRIQPYATWSLWPRPDLCARLNIRNSVAEQSEKG